MAFISVFQDVLRRYPRTIWLLIPVSIYAWMAYPMEPQAPVDLKLFVLDGMPQYINTSSTTISGVAFKVNDVLLNCDINSLGGSGGCEFFAEKIDLKRPARATFFLMEARLGNQFKVLNSLEQGGKVIVPQSVMRAWHQAGYDNQVESYHVVLWILYAPVFLLFVMDSLLGKHRAGC